MGTKGYIATAVLTEKPQSVEAAPQRLSCTNHNRVVVNDIRMTRVAEIEVTMLTIDENSYGGGDPYNSTGKRCVLKPRKEQR